MAYMPPKLESRRARTQPVIRAQSDDVLPVLRIPTPDELGIVSADQPLDWTMVERELNARGVSSYQMDKTVDGFAFTFKSPAGTIVGQGSTRSEAMRKALAQLGS